MEKKIYCSDTRPVMFYSHIFIKKNIQVSPIKPVIIYVSNKRMGHQEVISSLLQDTQKYYHKYYHCSGFLSLTGVSKSEENEYQ